MGICHDHGTSTFAHNGYFLFCISARVEKVCFTTQSPATLEALLIWFSEWLVGDGANDIVLPTWLIEFIMQGLERKSQSNTALCLYVENSMNYFRTPLDSPNLIPIIACHESRSRFPSTEDHFLVHDPTDQLAFLSLGWGAIHKKRTGASGIIDY